MSWSSLESFLRFSKLYGIIFCIVLVFGVTIMSADENISLVIPEIKNSLTTLDFSAPIVYPEPIQKYFKYYGLDYPDTKHIFGTFVAEKELLVVHFFVPANYRATVILVHGYLDHSGIFKNIIRNLIEQNYAVAVYDLQGYGLSSGEKAHIDDFSQYVTVLDKFIKICRKELPGSLHIVGYSMGATVVMEYMFTKNTNDFDKVVLAAPLIRSALWDLSQFGYALTNPFIKTVPRMFRHDSSDKEFLRFIRKDPLQTRVVPLSWVKALYNWNNRAKNYEPSNKKMLVLQGDKDCVVLWKYNLKFIKEKFPAAEIVIIPQCNHQLFNELDSIKQKVFSIINSYLTF